MSPDLGSLTLRSQIGIALVAAGVVLLLVPSLAPVQQVLYHETGPGTVENGTTLEREGFTVVEYEELSDRGQELYGRALRNGGRTTVPVGHGASDFPYLAESELAEYENYEERERARSVVIERPDGSDLPPADEPLRAAEYRVREDGENEQSTPSEAEIQQRESEIARYDVMATYSGEPPLNGTQHLLRLLALLAGVVAIGTGGYLLATH